MIKVLHAVACPFTFILFDDIDWQGGVLKVMKNYHFLVFLNCLSLFSQNFGQVKGDLCLNCT